ncbi:MAG: toll/interleukin-1 receptor domain-containing protein [Planctomycetaceae bacterium]|nr:toll/interleukin-1 receptor domain-containing protein [Planctomycetaceae bacterium]
MPSTDRSDCFSVYGRRDAKSLADRPNADLTLAGFEVWQDTREIRAGKKWEQEIRDGLHSTQIMIAVLTWARALGAPSRRTRDEARLSYLRNFFCVKSGKLISLLFSRFVNEFTETAMTKQAIRAASHFLLTQEEPAACLGVSSRSVRGFISEGMMGRRSAAYHVPACFA